LLRKYTFCYQHSIKEGYIMGHNLWDMHHLAYITISILIEHSIMIQYSITVVIYCHIDMHCWSLLCVPEYFSSQYPNNANPSIFFTVNKLHYMLCSFVVPNWWTIIWICQCFPPSMFSSYYHQTMQRVCTFAYSHVHEARKTQP